MTTICIFCAKHTKLNVIRNGITRLCKMKKLGAFALFALTSYRLLYLF